MAFKFKQGYYVVKNTEKYIGDVDKVVYRSSWELEVHKFFDNNPKILKWGSECVTIPYVKPTDGRVHKYYPDYLISYVNRHGEVKWDLIEVKPKEQTRKSRSRNPRTKLYEDLTYAVNVSKWEQATAWCKKQSEATGLDFQFRILTQQSIFK